jgi:predicted nucleic acid-binding protein
MNGRPFLDTNVLVYALTSNDPRSARAEELLAEGGIVSVQVLNELASVLRRKQGRDWDEVRETLAVVRTLLDPPRALTLQTHESALGIAQRYGFGFYDSLVVAAAIEARCPILYTEDLQDGQSIDGTTIRDPFAPIIAQGEGV